MEEKLRNVLKEAPWIQYPDTIETTLGNQLTDYGMDVLIEYLIENDVIVSNKLPVLSDVELETFNSFKSIIEKYKIQGNNTLIIRIMKYLFDMSEEDIIKELKGDND